MTGLAVRRRLARERLRSQQHRTRLLERPWIARRGIHGPRYFRTLWGAQGWCDAHWSEGTPEIRNGLTGEFYRRENGDWRWAGAKPQPEPVVSDEPAETPYWMKPL